MRHALARHEPIHLIGQPSDGIPLDEAVALCSSVTVPALSKWLPPRAVGRQGCAVTVVIPTHRRIPMGLARWLQQDVAVNVVVLSNGTDGPVSIDGCRVLRVPWRGHGATRQAALQMVTTPYVLFSVDDAIPLGEGFVRTLVEGLEGGPWDAVVARQIPWPDADGVTRSRLRQWTPPGVEIRSHPQCDHVATLYRTDILHRHPIPDVPIAEDAWWSVGRRIGYVPTAPVLHSHPRKTKALYVRNRDIHRELVRMGRAPTVPSMWALMRSLPSGLRPALEGQFQESTHQIAELLGQWQGARSAR